MLIPDLGRDVGVSQVRRGSGWEESWVLLRGGRVFCPLGLDAVLWGLYEVFRSSLTVVPQKNASVVESSSLSGSVWLMPHPDL